MCCAVSNECSVCCKVSNQCCEKAEFWEGVTVCCGECLLSVTVCVIKCVMSVSCVAECLRTAESNFILLSII